MKYLLVLSSMVLLFIQCKSDVKEERMGNSSRASSYTENFRPQFHFSAESGRMDNPVSIVHLDDEYHLFYSHSSDINKPGESHWGHAISSDLLHWEHHPNVLEQNDQEHIFSGDVIVDTENSAGFGKNTLVAIYDYIKPQTKQAGGNKKRLQSMAYSTDKGKTFTRNENHVVNFKPAINNMGNSKIIWDKEHNQWIMLIADQDHLKFYGSTNLTDWDHLSDWGHSLGSHDGIWEIPDIFPIQVNNTREIKWIILQSINSGGPNDGSSIQYFVGDFDGTYFMLDPVFQKGVENHRAVWLDCGKDNYAGMSWSKFSTHNDRVLFLGRMAGAQYAQVVPGTKWRGSTTLMRELSLYHENGNYRLRSLPISQLNSIENEQFNFVDKSLDKKSTLIENATGLYKIDLSLDRPNSKPVVIKCSNDLGEYSYIGFDPIDNKFFIDRSKSGTVNFSPEFSLLQLADIEYEHETLDMLVYIDHSSMELFADEGQTVMTSLCYPSEPFNKIELIYANIEMNPMKKLKLSTLKSIWR